MVTKATGRPRGRPKMALQDDPERYVLAWYEAVSRLNEHTPKFSRRGLALHIAMVWRGELVNNPENIEHWLKGSGPVAFQATKRRGVEGSKDPRHATAFHPIADDIARKARALGCLDSTSGDGVWWIAMVNSWKVALAEPDFILAQYPIVWCRLIGEYPFQQRVLARFVEARFGGRALPQFSLPDFIPHDVV